MTRVQRTAAVVLFQWLARPECRAEKEGSRSHIHVAPLGGRWLSGQPLVSSFPGAKAKSACGSHCKPSQRRPPRACGLSLSPRRADPCEHCGSLNAREECLPSASEAGWLLPTWLSVVMGI